MNKEIEIRGKKFSEETIVEALKAHTDWPEEHEFKPGDVARYHGSFSDARLIVNINGIHYSIDERGRVMAYGDDINEELYEYAGRCSRFGVKQNG